MSVRIRNDRFVVDFYPRGRAGKRERVTLPASVTDIEVAREIERDLRQASPESEFRVDQERATIGELIPGFLADLDLHAASRGTYRDMKGVLEGWVKQHLARFRMADLPGAIDMYKRLRKGTQVTDRTINKELSYISSMLRWAREEKGVRVPEMRVKHFKYHRPRPIVLELPELFALLKCFPAFYRAFFILLSTTGCRWNEARHVEWKDLDVPGRMIMLRQTKGGEQRGVPVPKLLMWALNQIRPERADGLIFRSPVTGGPIVNVRRAIAKAKEAAGITKRVTPHILRHSFATALTARNYNLALTQAWLGHKKESTTADMYAHIQPEHLRGAEKVLGLPARFPVTTTKAPMTRGRKKR